MKKAIALVMSLVFAMSLAACSGNVKTKDEVKGTDTPAQTEQKQDTAQQPAGAKPKITLLSMSSNEKAANIVRDQLTKNGFDVTVNLQPDYSSYKSLIDSHSYDVALSSWTTVTGNPDYAVRSLFKTGGDYNNNPVEDPKVDEYIEKAASETPDKYVETYKEFEQYLVGEKAYIAPLYSSIKTQAVNKEILKADSVALSKSRSQIWEKIDFVDESKRETEPMITSQAISELTSLDPIKGNDGSINIINTNMYVRLVNLTNDDQVVSDGSLSYEHAIKDNNQDFYFVLRDDINFSKVEDFKAVDSGVRVGGEDVVFALDRAKNKDSVPNHRTYSLHESMDTITIVTDLAELESSKSASGKSVKETLETKTPSAITSLTADKTAVDNAAGVYQVVKVTTKNPFPQVLNYLAHQSAGIVSKDQVEAINTYDVATYDVQKDVAYGDQAAITEGATYNNTLMCSGPYIATLKNDYQVTFQKNPAYMKGTEWEPKITNYTMKFIKDPDSALSALRSGEIYMLYSVPEAKFDLVTNDPKLVLQEMPSNAVFYMNFNQKGQMASENLRKAVVYSINQDELISVFLGRAYKTYSTLSTMVPTGTELVADSAKVQEALAAWAAEAK